MIIFKKENKTTITSEEEYPDYISQTESVKTYKLYIL